MAASNFDVLVVGGGIVGASAALALRGTASRIGLIDPAEREDIGAEWDSRIYAMSQASVDFLEALGVWPRLDTERVARCTSMQVFGDALGSKIEFSAYDIGVSALATMVEERALACALAECITASPAITRFRQACIGLATTGEAAALTLADGTTLHASLVVGADGASSWVRKSAGVAADVLDYGQLGVVANFATSKPHHGCAFQWFRGDGVLAFLPLPKQRMSMVWSTATAHGRSLLDLSPTELSRRVAAASNHAMGELKLITPPRAFVLQRLPTRSMLAERTVLIGDAAHVIHPLAGQGMNLGLGDARELAATLAKRERFRDLSDPRLLRRYERARREDILAARTLTHGLHRLFSLDGWIPSAIRNLGLNFFDALPVIKALLARRALG